MIARADPAAAVREFAMPSALRPLAAALLLAALGLAACATPPERNRFADITFEHLPDMELAVADIEVVDAYRPPLEEPYVEHLFPVKPAAAAERWARDRLVATGAAGTAVYTVEVGSVTEEELETSGGLAGLFTSEPAQRYEARVRVRMEIRGTGDEMSVEVRRTASVPEGASLNERERVWYELVDKLMSDLNGQLEKTIRKTFARYLAA